jgi:hypothetical protein
VMLWLGRRQNEMQLSSEKEWPRMTYYSSGGWESGGSRRVAGCGGADSIFQFQLERGSDETKHCRKMQQRQRARLGSMGKKRDMA